jgi:hypothetical protein
MFTVLSYVNVLPPMLKVVEVKVTAPTVVMLEASVALPKVADVIATVPVTLMIALSKLYVPVVIATEPILHVPFPKLAFIGPEEDCVVNAPLITKLGLLLLASRVPLPWNVPFIINVTALVVNVPAEGTQEPVAAAFTRH